MTRQCAASASLLWLTLLFSMLAAIADEPGADEPSADEIRADEPGTAQAQATTAEPVQAIWKHQEISFYFQSFTTFYSCTALEGKVENIMRELGVHAQVRVRSANCPSSVAVMPRVVMSVVSPVEATPEALAERDKNKSVRELVERVRGKSDHPLDSLEQFPAQWRRVSLTRGRLNLDPGDCELVEQLEKKVLPKLAVRTVNKDVQCTPYQPTLGPPRLEVEALMAMPKPDEPTGERQGS